MYYKNNNNKNNSRHFQILCGLVLLTVCYVTAEYDDVSGEYFSEEEREYLPGRTSYFDKLRKSQKLQFSMATLRNNQTLQQSVLNVARDLRQLHSLAELSHLWSSDDQTKLPPAVTQVLNDVRAKHLGDAPDPKNRYCVNDTGRVMLGLMQKQPWAMQMFDASGKPGAGVLDGRFHWIGDYTQCRSVVVGPDPALYSQGFSGQYVEATMYVSLYPGAKAKWGLCFPDSCNAYQIYNFMKDSLQYFKIKAVPGPIEIKTNKREVTTATKASIAILSVIGFLMLVGTLYDVIALQYPKWEEEKERARMKARENKNGYTSVTSNGYYDDRRIQRESEKDPLLGEKETGPGKLAQAVLAFSVYTNVTKFLSTKQPTGSLSAIHGIRFLSMSWVMLAHMFAFGSENTLNATGAYQFLQRWTFDVIGNGFPSVDTFFTLSGLLTGYLTLKGLLKAKSIKINWGLFYFHRFWRLTPPYMLTLTLALGLSQYLGDGALWKDVTPDDKTSCEEKWWTNLLYVNNLVDDAYCFGHSWYLANDMQFFVITPLMLIPFFFHTGAGLVTSAVAMFAHMLATGLITTHYDIPASSLAGAGHTGGDDWMSKYYVKPWCRIGPYIVGLVVGCLLAKKQIRLNRFTAVLGWMVFTATGLAVVYGLHGQIVGDYEASKAVNALYNGVSRSAWGAAVCWVIVSCYLGYGGLVNSILSFSAFVPLGRLTYMSYLVHPPLIYAYYDNMDTLFFMKDYNIIIMFLGMFALVNMVAFVLMLFLESPMIGLEKALLPQRKR